MNRPLLPPAHRTPIRLLLAGVLLVGANLMGAPRADAAVTPQTFTAHALTLDGLFATVDITVKPGIGAITVAADGAAEPLGRLSIHAQGDTVVVHQDHRHHSMETDIDRLRITVTVPTGTTLSVSDFIGDTRAGDLGDLAVTGLHSGRVMVGAVRDAALEITGSGTITTGAIGGDLHATINGSGTVKTGATHGKVGLTVNGSGDITVARVDGPVSAAIHGSGMVLVQAGRANPLAVDVAGTGDFTLHGTATAQTVHQAGLARVTIGP